MGNYYLLIVIWCIVLSSFTVFTPLKMRRVREKRKDTLQILLYVSCIVILAADVCSVIFMGHTGRAVTYIVKVTNYVEYIARYAYFAIFALFLQNAACREGGKIQLGTLLSITNSCLGIGWITLSQISARFYYFDENNFFNYNNQYATIQASFLAASCLLFFTLLENRNECCKRVFWYFFGYLSVLTGVMAADFFLPMWEMQNLTIFFSTQLIFLNDMFTVSDKYMAQLEENAMLQYRATHDMMTGLWNKKSGLQQMEQCLAQMKDSDTAALLFVDIDDFKKINDTYGHENGDYWIENVAALLKNIWEEKGIVSRYGGDEFIIFSETGRKLETLEQKVQLFQKQLAEKALTREQTVHCSIGVCWIEGRAESLSNCIQCADETLYKVKEKGKNSYFIYRMGETHL